MLGYNRVKFGTEVVKEVVSLPVVLEVLSAHKADFLEHWWSQGTMRTAC